MKKWQVTETKKQIKNSDFDDCNWFIIRRLRANENVERH
jgi:hypothetical protein